jgi:hypothetical protein
MAKVGACVAGIVRDLGNTYADGSPRFEIHVPVNRAEGLPFQTGHRVDIQLKVANVKYEAGLRATVENKYVWVCPDLIGTGGEKTRLYDVLAAAGFQANDPVNLLIDGLSLIVQRV